jgi:hypothetical protein
MSLGGVPHEREDKRLASVYEHRWFVPANQFESVWLITSNGDIAFRRQARVRNGVDPCWSLGDTLADIFVLLAFARALWRTSGYYGEAQLDMSLNVHGLRIMYELALRKWPSGPGADFEREDFNAALRDSIVSPATHPQSTSGASGVFNSGLPYDGVTEMVANLLNQALRTFGEGADLAKLKRSVEIFLQAFK